MITQRDQRRIARVLGQFGAKVHIDWMGRCRVTQGMAVREVLVPEDVVKRTTAKRWPTILAHLEEWGEW